MLGPFLPLCRAARPARHGARARARRVERVEVELPGPHRRARHAPAHARRCCSACCAGHTEEDVNLVNAPALAEERGIEVVRAPRARRRATTPTSSASRSSPAASASRVVGTTLGPPHRPHLLEAWGQRFNLQLDDPHLALFRYSDVPGMVGRVGTAFGEHGVNISSAAVGRQPRGRPSARDLAVMAITTDAAGAAGSGRARSPRRDGFVAGRAVALADD